MSVLCRLFIQAYEDRKNLCQALLNSGYTVSIQEHKEDCISDTEFIVVISTTDKEAR